MVCALMAAARGCRAEQAVLEAGARCTIVGACLLHDTLRAALESEAGVDVVDVLLGGVEGGAAESGGGAGQPLQRV